MAINFNKEQLKVLIDQRKERVAHYKLLWERPTKSKILYLKNIASELKLWEKRLFDLENPHLENPHLKKEKESEEKTIKKKEKK